MRIERTFIEGLIIIIPDMHLDSRGSFMKVMNKDFFKEHNLEYEFCENYFSVSKKNVIRGMHFQIPPAHHTKVVYLNQGSIMDVVLDLRSDSATFGKFFRCNINTSEPKILYIPVGCAHGFLSYEDNTIVSYLQTACYDSNCDKGIKYDSFGMDWNVKNPILSFRDSAFPDFNSNLNIFK